MQQKCSELKAENEALQHQLQASQTALSTLEQKLYEVE